MSLGFFFYHSVQSCNIFQRKKPHIDLGYLAKSNGWMVRQLDSQTLLYDIGKTWNQNRLMLFELLNSMLSKFSSRKLKEDKSCTHHIQSACKTVGLYSGQIPFHVCNATWKQKHQQLFQNNLLISMWKIFSYRKSAIFSKMALQTWFMREVLNY